MGSMRISVNLATGEIEEDDSEWKAADGTSFDFNGRILMPDDLDMLEIIFRDIGKPTSEDKIHKMAKLNKMISDRISLMALELRNKRLEEHEKAERIVDFLDSMLLEERQSKMLGDLA